MNASDRSPEPRRERPEDHPPASLPVDDPDAMAIRATLAGNSNAYGEIVTRHHRSLVRVLVGIVFDPHLAEDIAQEVWWIAYRKLETFGFRSRFRTWLHRIAVREALSARTRIRRLLSRSQPLHDTRATTLAVESDTSEETRRALDRLPATERAAFSLYLEDFSYDEIAAALGCPSGTVATHIHRARQRLARILESTAREPRPATRPIVPAERERTP